MPFDEPEESEPLAIQSAEQARTAAQCIFDWTDWNLSAVESSDMDPGWSFKAYKAAEALVEALALRPADAPSAGDQTPPGAT